MAGEPSKAKRFNHRFHGLTQNRGKSDKSGSDISIKIKNHRCFRDEFAGFDKIMPVNIIIGRNNAGKSALLDLLAFARGRGELTREEKLELDVRYVETAGLMTDLKIVLATIGQVFGRSSIYEKKILPHGRDPQNVRNSATKKTAGRSFQPSFILRSPTRTIVSQTMRAS
jgi:ATPase subunit of ABC transporter with duplicated ATPase domains